MFNWWKKQTPQSAPAVTRTVPATRDYAPLSDDYTVRSCFLSDAGCQRDTNQDYGALIEPHVELLKRKGRLAIVADGLGGHAGGATASRLAVETIRRSYYEASGDVRTSLQQAFESANREIYRTAQRDFRLYRMGTTCTALALRGHLAYCAHVGDSRLYLLREGEIYLMSEDHSAVMDLVRRGVMNRETARNHADRNVLLRALGTRPEIKVTIWEKPFPVRVGDAFVLCSDGLYDLVEDEEIKSAALETEEPSAACERLIALAKERGGHDNITVGLLQTRQTMAEMRNMAGE
jgi:protein phosphatase